MVIAFVCITPRQLPAEMLFCQVAACCRLIHFEACEAIVFAIKVGKVGKTVAAVSQ